MSLLQRVHPRFLFWVLLHLLSSHPIPKSLQDVQIRQSVCVLRFPFFPSRVVFFRFSHVKRRETRQLPLEQEAAAELPRSTRIAQIPKNTHKRTNSPPQDLNPRARDWADSVEGAEGVAGRASLEKIFRRREGMAVIVITYLQIHISSVSH